MIVAAELFNNDGTRTDETSTVSMHVWDVSIPNHKNSILTTRSLHYIDGGVWCYDFVVQTPQSSSFVIVFENHEDIPGEDNFLVVGMIEPPTTKSTNVDYVLLAAGQKVLGEAKSTPDGMRIKMADGKDLLIRRKP